MKKFFALFAVAAMLFACEEPVPETTLALDDANNATLNLSTDAATKVVAFTTNAAWTAAADAEWIEEVTPASGVAGTAIELTIKVTENTTYDARSGKVTITAGDKNVEIAVNQVQVDEMNVGELTTLTVGYEGGEVKLPVNHNVEFTVESDSDWAVVAEGTKALTTTEVVINVAKNTTGAARVANLTVEAAGGFEYEVVLTQDSNVLNVYSVNSTDIVAQVGAVTLSDTDTVHIDANTGAPINILGVVSMALWDGKLVVCAGDGTMPKLVNKETGAVEGELATGGFVPYYVANDDAGNLVMCNRVYNNSKVWAWEVYFSVYYMTPGATEAVKAFNVNEPYDNPPRHMGANFAVRGDITKNAAVWVPVEVPSGYGGSNVNAWDIVDGVAGTRQNFNVSGFSGMESNFKAPNYWATAPNNFPSFALMGTTVAQGAVMFANYPDNGVYTVAADGTATLVAPTVIGGNNNANAIDMISAGNKAYVALCAASYFHWGGTASEVRVFSLEGTTFAPVGNVAIPTSEAPAGSVTSDVCLEVVEGGLNVYYLDNVTTTLSAYHIVF